MVTPVVILERFGSAGWREMIDLRHRVLRAPLGLAYSEAALQAEAGQLHLALRLGPALAGTVLLVPPDAGGVAQLRQMAIDPDHAGQGLGRFLLGETARQAAALGATSVTLSARVSAIGFYERGGYRVSSEPYIEVTLPHRRMQKSLSALTD